MKLRTLIVVILGILAVSSVSLAQDAAVPEQELQEPAFSQSDSPELPQPEPILVAQTPSPTEPQARGSRRTTTKPPMATPPSSMSIRRTPLKNPTQMRIFRLRYADAVDMASMMENVFRIQVYADELLDNIIVIARPEQMESI